MSKAAIDWEAIEREYRAGQLSLREIAAIHGVSHVSIHKRAKRDGWEQDLSEAVREKVNAKLVNDGVNGKSARETVEIAAERGVQIIREHRVSIGRGQRFVATLFGELEEATENRDEIEAAIEVETADDRSGKRRAMMLRAVELPARAGVLLTLSTALKNLVGLERQAFNLGAEEERADGGPITLEALIMARIKPPVKPDDAEG